MQQIVQSEAVPVYFRIQVDTRMEMQMRAPGVTPQKAEVNAAVSVSIAEAANRKIRTDNSQAFLPLSLFIYFAFYFSLCFLSVPSLVAHCYSECLWTQSLSAVWVLLNGF